MTHHPITARQVYTGFKSAPFREADEPAPADLQALITRSEDHRPAAAPLLAARQAEREQFAATVAKAAELVANADDDAWREPDKRTSIALVLATISGSAVALGLGWALYLMTRVG